MEQTFARILLLLCLSAAFAKYVYIQNKIPWYEAQVYCRMLHTDLAPFSGTHDSERLQRLASKYNWPISKAYIWIGLRRNVTDKNKWTWSGGGGVSTFLWDKDEPQNTSNEDYGLIHDYKWHDATPEGKYNFLCYRAVVVNKTKTWEEALEYCRTHHHDLASVASDTEMLLIQKELNDPKATTRFWIGLRLFPEGWLWVDKQPLDYEAWGQKGKPGCPSKRRCAALQGTGRNQSCRATDATLGFITNDALNPLNTYECDVKVGEWEARDCVERLPFICY